MAFERLLNSVHETHIVFKNLSNINGDMLQKAWGLKIGEDSIERGRISVRPYVHAYARLYVFTGPSPSF